MRTLVMFIPFLLCACGTVADDNQRQEQIPLSITMTESRMSDTTGDMKSEQKVIELKFTTNFPSGTKIIFSLIENRDAVKPPLVRESSDTILVTDSVIRWSVAPVLLPAGLVISVPENMQSEDVKSVIAKSKVTHESELHCPQSLFCRSYSLEFVQEKLSATDTFMITRQPLEVSFRESLMK